jgi:hypothetical protein
MNWKGLGKKWPCLIAVLPLYLSQGPGKSTQYLFIRLRLVLAEIRSQNPPDAPFPNQLARAWLIVQTVCYFHPVVTEVGMC